MEYRIVLLWILFGSMFVDAQERATGRVVTQDNEPVVGANVSIEGTTESTVTDIDGRFVLPARPGSDILIVLPAKKPKPIIIANRLSVWVDGGLTTTPDVWGKGANGEYSLAGGGIGVGYQRVSNSFLLTVGLEFRSLNYCRFFRMYRYENKDVYINKSVPVNSGFVQIPVLIGMELNYFYWQIGGKVGTALYNNYSGVAFNSSHSEYKFLRVAPALELGAHFSNSPKAESQEPTAEKVLHVDYKVAVCAEWGFEFIHQGHVSPLGSCDWTNAMIGLKFAVGFHTTRPSAQ